MTAYLCFTGCFQWHTVTTVPTLHVCFIKSRLISECKFLNTTNKAPSITAHWRVDGLRRVRFSYQTERVELAFRSETKREATGAAQAVRSCSFKERWSKTVWLSFRYQRKQKQLELPDTDGFAVEPHMAVGFRFLFKGSWITNLNICCPGNRSAILNVSNILIRDLITVSLSTLQK